jgi:polyphosphate kinase 2 (PPK2 family)
MKKTKSLTTLLSEMAKLTKVIHNKEALVEQAKALQLNMLRIQQGVFHKKDRVIIMFEGFDAAGKGGAIRALTERLDPRSFKVIPIGEPTVEEKGKPWLYRFWRDLPAPGEIVIFDRSWYGRVLVEKVDHLTPADKLSTAYDEINQFEAQLQSDGIVLIKIFLAISKEEQLVRFEDRLKDPYKQWKITMADISARKNWNKYVKAVDEILVQCSPATSPWHVIPANSKRFTRKEVLTIVTTHLKFYQQWIEKAASKYPVGKLTKLLNKA